MRVATALPSWARLALGLLAAFPAASLVVLGLAQSGLGETVLHRIVERLGGDALEIVWHPVAIVGGLALALLLSLGDGRARVARRVLAFSCAGLAAVIVLYLLAENLQLFATLRA